MGLFCTFSLTKQILSIVVSSNRNLISRESRESRENASLHSRSPAGWLIRAIAMYTSRDSRDSREVSLPKTALCKIVHAYNRIGRRLRNAF